MNTIPNKEKTGKLIWLDFARGISAVLVCAGHLRAATFTDYSDLGAGRTIVMPFYFLTGLGHEAVMIFFVLSGFLVGGSVLRKRNEFSVHAYTVARCSRLYTVLIPSLIFTFLIDRVLGFYCPGVLNGEYFGQLHSGPVGPGDYSNSISTLLLNLLFLQTIASPVFGTNGPLWSLANEFWYYVLFPLAWFVLFPWRNGRIRYRLFAFALASVITSFLTIGIISGFVVWLFGVVAYVFYQRSSSVPKNFLVATSLFVFLLILVFGKLEYFQSFEDWILGAGFAWVCLQFARTPNPPQRGIWIVITGMVSRLSDISYSLYLVHFPVVILISMLFFREQKMSPFNGSSYVVFLVLLFGLILFGQLFWLAFEKHTPTVRSAMKRFSGLSRNRNRTH